MQCSATEGINPPKENVILPQATKFLSIDGKIAQYFFKNNPWKLSEENDSQKIFRFCIICGENRFSDDDWVGIIENMCGKPPTICNKMDCWDQLAYLPGSVPRRHYMIETEEDMNRVYEAHTKECFEEIKEVTSHVRFDKVFKDESEMPQEYIETFKKLEGFPVETRISEIDSIYVSYAEKNDIEMGEYLHNTSDPFLRSLAEYRQKCIVILNKIRKSTASSTRLQACF